jgi:hypothetical protein
MEWNELQDLVIEGFPFLFDVRISQSHCPIGG